MSDRLEIELHRQTAFGDDGQPEVTETSIETSLEDSGANVDHRDRDLRLDRPEVREFSVEARYQIMPGHTGSLSPAGIDTSVGALLSVSARRCRQSSTGLRSHKVQSNHRWIFAPLVDFWQTSAFALPSPSSSSSITP